MRCLLLVAMLLCAASAQAGDSHDERNGRPGDGRGGPPKVYDARGEYVGQLGTNNGVDGVFLTISGAVTFVGVERASVGTQLSATQFQWTTSSYIEYPSTDCSGPPVLEYNNGRPTPYTLGPRPSVAVRQGADVVLYVAGEADSTTVQAWSYRTNPVMNVCKTYSASLERGQVFALDTTYQLTQIHPEPLTIRN